MPVQLFAAMGGRVRMIRELEAMSHKFAAVSLNRVYYPSESIRRQRIMACVIWVLSNTPALGEAYLLSKGCTTAGRNGQWLGRY